MTPASPSPVSSADAPSLSTAAELRALLRLAGPVVASQFAANALALIATAVIGRLGERELAAAAYANASYYLIYMLVVGVMLSVAPRVAQAHGAGDQTGVARALRGGLVLAARLTAVTLPLMWVLSLVLPRYAPAGVDTGLIATYLRVYSLGMLPNLVFIALRGTLEGTGKPGAVTAVALAGVVWAGLVAPALAFGWGPLPRLGLGGAAAASASAAWLMAALLWPQAHRRATLAAGERLGHVGEEVRALFRLGWPIGLTLGAEGGMFSVTTLLVARFGPEVLAAHNITLQAITAIFMVPLGVASATGVRVGQAAGAGRLNQDRRAGLVGMGVAAAFMLGVAVLELLAPHAVFSVFVNVHDPANAPMLKTAAALLAIAAIFQVVDGLQVTANGALRGLQDTRVPLIVSLVSYWLIGLSSGVWMGFARDMGVRGLWYGLTIGLFCAASALVVRFLLRTAKGRREVQPSSPAAP